MKVKNLTVDKIVEGTTIVVKCAGSHPKGTIFQCYKKVGQKSLKFRKVTRSAFDFIYEFKDSMDVVVRKPKSVESWPGWSPAMDKWDGYKFRLSMADIESFDEDGISEHYVMLDDEVGVNLNWLEPACIPEFKDSQYKHLFKPVEIALPKKPLGLSEIKLLSDDSITEAFARIKKGANGTANWCVITNGKIEDEFYQACHYDLKRAGKCDYIVTEFGKCKTKEAIWWGYYLANLSPLKGCFLTKDIESIVENGAYVLDVTQPANAIGMACIASRQPWEYPDRVVAFYKLCERGVPVDLAFLAAQKAMYQGDDLKWTRDHTGHGVIPISTIGDKGCISFINHEYTKPNPPFKEDNDYFGTDNLYRGGGASSLSSMLGDIGGERVRGVIRALPEEESLNRCVEALQEWCDEYF